MDRTTSQSSTRNPASAASEADSTEYEADVVAYWEFVEERLRQVRSQQG